METTLVFCVSLATHLHAESIARSSNAASSDSNFSADATTLSSFFDIDDELTKIAAASCLRTRDYEELTGNIVRDTMARSLSAVLIDETLTTIGLRELRATLKFAPLRPWKHCNYKTPSEGDLASAPTTEAYYDLKEPSSKARSLDSSYLFEHNLTPAIAFLDKRFPSIRTIFRRTFEEIRRSDPGVLDRKVIDRLIVEFWAVRVRVGKAIKVKRWNNECWDSPECSR